MTERRHQSHVLISWIDNQGADLMRIFQADVLPRLSAIDRFKDSGPVGRITANSRFACAGVNHIVIGGRDGDRADRRNRLLIE